MTTCLVTGGAGFIGSHIVEALVAAGNQVRVVDNLNTGRTENLAHLAKSIEFIQGDIQDPELMRTALKNVGLVFHQAALASVPRSMKDPLATHGACVTGTVVLLDEARRAGVRRVVYAASSSAYGDSQWASKREADLPNPISPYAAAKLSAELYCRAFSEAFGLETVALRYFNVFGPRQDPNGPYAAVIPRFIQVMLSGQSPVIFGDGKQSRDFTYIENVVQANLLASQAPQASGRVFNVAMGRSTSLLELVEQLNEILGTKIAAKFDEPRAGDVRDSLADISAATKTLGFSPKIELKEGLRRTVDSMR